MSFAAKLLQCSVAVTASRIRVNRRKLLKKRAQGVLGMYREGRGGVQPSVGASCPASDGFKEMVGEAIGAKS